MFRPFLIVPALFLLGAPAFFQQTAPNSSTPPASAQTAAQTAQAWSVPPEWVNKQNPVTPTPESQARAKQIYSWDCAACHGVNGNGKGDVAAEQKLNMLDYRDPTALAKLTDGEIFYIIRNGKDKMPAEGERAKDDEVWNLVIYLRKMAGQPAAAATRPPA